MYDPSALAWLGEKHFISWQEELTIIQINTELLTRLIFFYGFLVMKLKANDGVPKWTFYFVMFTKVQKRAFPW